MPAKKTNQKKGEKRPPKGGKKLSGTKRFCQKGLQKGGKNHEKRRKKVTENRNGLGAVSGGVFHDFWDEKGGNFMKNPDGIRRGTKTAISRGTC